MPIQPQFPDRYPRGTSTGTIAILCEGDVGGYESALLDEWAAIEKPQGLRADVWPCGTGDGLFAMADAIGRTVRVIVIEDRDFRTIERANAECAEKCVERESRNIAMRGWMSWCRNEIENYFLDREALDQGMCEAFDCKERDVDDALDVAIKSLVVFQSVKTAGSVVAADWNALVESRYPGGGKPKWKAEGLVAPDADTVRGQLEDKFKGLRKKVLKKVNKYEELQEPFVGKRLLAEFNKREEEWRSGDRSKVPWTTDWAGKEILKLVRQQLATRFRAPIASKQTKIPPVHWHLLSTKASKDEDSEQDALDRDIERAIQPLLVARLWEFAQNSVGSDMRSDLNRLVRLFAP